MPCQFAAHLARFADLLVPELGRLAGNGEGVRDGVAGGGIGDCLGFCTGVSRGAEDGVGGDGVGRAAAGGDVEGFAAHTYLLTWWGRSVFEVFWVRVVWGCRVEGAREISWCLMYVLPMRRQRHCLPTVLLVRLRDLKVGQQGTKDSVLWTKNMLRSVTEYAGQSTLRTVTGAFSRC